VKVSRSDDASGSAVAKVVRAKLRGVKLDCEKSMLEKVTPPRGNIWCFADGGLGQVTCDVVLNGDRSVGNFGG
jgi:hypothetical protein